MKTQGQPVISKENVVKTQGQPVISKENAVKTQGEPVIIKENAVKTQGHPVISKENIVKLQGHPVSLQHFLLLKINTFRVILRFSQYFLKGTGFKKCFFPRIN